MPIKYTYNQNENIVRGEAAGRLSIGEIETYAKNLLFNSDIKPGFIEILDLKGVMDFDFTFETGRKIINIYRQLYKEKDFRGSIHLSPEDMQFGISSLMSAILENVSTVYTVREKDEISLALTML